MRYVKFVISNIFKSIKSVLLGIWNHPLFQLIGLILGLLIVLAIAGVIIWFGIQFFFVDMPKQMSMATANLSTGSTFFGSSTISMVFGIIPIILILGVTLKLFEAVAGPGRYSAM
jgi:hypothetical protein